MAKEEGVHRGSLQTFIIHEDSEETDKHNDLSVEATPRDIVVPRLQRGSESSAEKVV